MGLRDLFVKQVRDLAPREGSTLKPILEINEVSKRFAGLLANDCVSFSVADGECVGLIGPNGAGKTTLFNCVAGYYTPTSGTVVFEGTDITGWRPNAVCYGGLARTFQIVKAIRNMTVLENVMVGAFCRTSSVDEARKIGLRVLEECELDEKKDVVVSALTIADLKRLEIARAWATKPRMLLLDEAMAGLTSTETKQAVSLVRRIKGTGVALLMVEHVMEALIPLVDRIVVLDQGRKIADDQPEVVLSDEQVISAYLGGEVDAGN